MKKINRRIAALIMLVLLLLSSTDLQYALAADKGSGKEEVVYAKLDGNGALQGTYVVNIWEDRNITDYGNYSRVSNLNTTDAISNKDGCISITSSKDRLYYEGVMEDAKLPWSIDIKYFMNGVSFSADEIAGKSGRLTLTITVKKNSAAKEGFFKNYALQALVKLDTKKCSNIEAEGATQANVGGMKQLTYTLLPGKEKEICITAEVTDFELESIQLNGIRLNLGIDSSSIDTSLIGDKMKELKEAVTDLDAGAKELMGGAGDLKAGAVELKEGIDTVQKALITLNSKSEDLTVGSGEVKAALKTIQASLQAVDATAKDLSALGAASVKIKARIDGLVGGLQTMAASVNTYQTKLTEAGLADRNSFVNKHKEAIAALGITPTQRALYSSYITSGESGVQVKLGELVKGNDTEAISLYKKIAGGDKQEITDYITRASKLIAIEGLLNADISYIQGSEQLISGIDGALDPEKGQLMTGALTLQSSYTAFNTVIQKLITTLGAMAADMTRLKAGIDRLTENYDSLDYGLLKYTDAVKKITDGYEQIYEGSKQLVNGTSDLYAGTRIMSDGTGEFVNETSDMEDKIALELDRMLDEYTGSDYPVASFVSEKNNHVKSVQFVIRTAAVEKKESAVMVTVEEKPLNLWQKFLRLFGWK